MPRSQIKFSFDTRRYSIIVFVIATLLLSVHVGLYLYNYLIEELPWLLLQLFDLDEEYNLPTWFSSFILLNNAFLLYLIANSQAVTHHLQWKILASGFLLLSIDEVAGIHESINTAIEINWAIPGGILALLIGVMFIPFLLALPRKRATLFVASGTLYILGAIIIELLSEDMDSDSLQYMLAVALEEGCEMLGAAMFLAVNLAYWSAAQAEESATN